MPDMTADDIVNQIVNEILDAFATCGHLDYGENISMQKHMLQAACFAEQKGEDDSTIVAALLHDYGQLVCNMPNNTFLEGIDNYHEEAGAGALVRGRYRRCGQAARRCQTLFVCCNALLHEETQPSFNHHTRSPGRSDECRRDGRVP